MCYPHWNKYKGDAIFADFQSTDLASIMQTVALSTLKYNLLLKLIFLIIYISKI